MPISFGQEWTQTKTRPLKTETLIKKVATRSNMSPTTKVLNTTQKINKKQNNYYNKQWCRTTQIWTAKRSHEKNTARAELAFCRDHKSNVFIERESGFTPGIWRVTITASLSPALSLSPHPQTKTLSICLEKKKKKTISISFFSFSFRFIYFLFFKAGISLTLSLSVYIQLSALLREWHRPF